VLELDSARAAQVPGAVWVRRGIANCYFHSPMVSLVRRVRERYRLENAKRGLWPTFRRREQATARILCYHRVNDERDPFFPSTPTRLFEAEMRFLSRRYRVVSLGELFRRLLEGPAEPVLAVTFDDGYRDNFENAFPILERFGLPATIFLATGSVDTGEPLWFERLAQALKTTRRESIEIETEPNRVIPLRTHAERLGANDHVLSVLRAATDVEHRRVLDHVLRQLGGHAGERHGKMLSWNDARYMSAHGIEFGGHTITHPFLSRVAPEEAVREVTICKRRIEAELQRPADFFAYPNGRHEDIGNDAKESVRQAGYRAAVTTIWGVNTASTDPFELRRGGPWEQTPALFASKLDWYELVEA
jgi:peptidoglycan/xylan/chitin deacetylase (PgdA/CDA1 family)